MNPYGDRLPSQTRPFLRSILPAFLGLLTLFAVVAEEPAGKPNFIIILADDLGYGDLGCYGSQRNQTPHIDQLAAEGIRFTDFHSNGPMCTPTRAALLTGRYQQRFGLKFESALGGKEHYDQGLPHAVQTLPESLKEQGYATGCFGKWHLGYQPPNLPLDHGFDVFVGLGSGDGDHHSHIDRSGRADWWNGNQRQNEDGYTADLLVQHALDFIEQHRDKPFFVYLPHLAIHFPWQGPEDPPHRKEGVDYWNDKWGLIPDPTNVSPHVKAMVESIDQGVGKLMAALRRWELDKNTVIFFLSDNGGYTHYGQTHQNISSNGPLRGQKTELFEGGHRVPAIAWWPGRIQPRVSHETTMSFDLAPTLLNLAGSPKHSVPQLDGTDLSQHLLKQESLPLRTLFWRMDNEVAVRRGPWKWMRLGDEVPLLFNLETDLAETLNLSHRYPKKASELAQAQSNWAQHLD